MMARAFSALREALSPFREAGPAFGCILTAVLEEAWEAFCLGARVTMASYIVGVLFFSAEVVPDPGGFEGHLKFFMSQLTTSFLGVCIPFLIVFAVVIIIVAGCFATYVVGAFRRDFSSEKQRLSNLKTKLPQPPEPFCPETKEINALERVMETDTFFYRVLYRFAVHNRLWLMELRLAFSDLNNLLVQEIVTARSNTIPATNVFPEYIHHNSS